MSEPSPSAGSAGQTFLVGETIYLRGLELSDARRASAWRSSPFPIAAERAEEMLKKELPAAAERRTTTLVACRIDGDEPVGAMTMETADWRTGWVKLHADPALGRAAADVKAEIVRLVVPWLSDERHMMVVHVSVDADQGPVVAAAEAVGMRPAFRLREAYWRDGGRHDQVVYERLHPGWMDLLGDPGPGIDAARPPAVVPRRPERQRDAGASDGTWPRNATMIGERVVLRPLEVEDGEQIARWSRQETETFFDNGRGLRSPILLAHWAGEIGKDEPPDEIEFAIALRDGGELIGDNGLFGIDWINRTAETGTGIYRPEHRGGGLGTEAKHLLLEYAFERLGLHMVRSFVWGPNTRSAAALRKQGYRDAGRLHWLSVQAGAFAEEVVFDLLAEEWRAGRQRRDEPGTR